MNDLLVKPIPYKTESPMVFLLRVVELNGWRSISNFLSSNDQFYKAPYIDRLVRNQNKWNKIMNSMGISIESRQLCYAFDEGDSESKKSLFGFFDVQVKLTDLRITNPMLCPKCLSENAYCKKQWDHKSISICTTHHNYLISRCPKCEKKLCWNRSRLLYCNCGLDLTTIDTEPVSLKYSLFINQIFLGTGHLQLLEFKNSSQAIKDFCKFIGKQCDSDDVFKITYSLFNDKQSAYSFIREGVFYALKSKGFHPRLSLVSFCQLNSAQLKGFFEGIFEGENKLDFNVDSDFNSFQLSIDQVRFVLGVPFELVRQLQKEGIVECFKKLKNSRIQTDAHSLNKFLMKLSSPKKVPRYKVRLDKISSPPLKGNILDSIKEIINDNVQYDSMKLEDGLYGVEVDLKSVKIGPRILSVQEASKICNTHFNNIGFAVRSGMLSRIDPSLTKDKFKYYMTRKEVNKFNNRYIFERAIARESCGNVYQVAQRLETLGVKPVSKPNNIKYIDKIYRRADLESINYDDVRLMKKSTIKLLTE